MEYYKVNSYHPITLVPTLVDTTVPKDVVENILDLLDHIDETKWSVCPMMIDPIDMGVIFSMIEIKDGVLGDICRIKISVDKK